MYRKLRNFASREERSLKSQYYCKLIEDAKNDSSSMWKALKRTLPLNHMDTNVIFANGKLHTNSNGIAEHLNHHFSNIGKYLAKPFCNTSSVLAKNVTSAYDFKLNPVSEMFVHKELGKMKANKAIGLDKNSVLDFYVTQPGSLPPVNLYHQFFLEAWKISFSLEICKGHCPPQTR